MKTRPTWLYAIFLLIGLIASSATYGQTGSSCSSSNSITLVSNTYVDTNTITAAYWYRFKPGNDTLTISTHANGLDKIQKIELYSGTCAGLGKIAVDSLSANNPTFLSILSTALDTTRYYYLEVTPVSANSTEYTILFATVPALIWENPDGTSGWCTNELHSSCSTTICLGESICFSYDIELSPPSTYSVYFANHATLNFSDGGSIVVENDNYTGPNPTGCVMYTPTTTGLITTTGVINEPLYITVLPSAPPTMSASINPGSPICEGTPICAQSLNSPVANWSFTATASNCTYSTSCGPGSTSLCFPAGVHQITYVVNAGHTCSNTAVYTVTVVPMTISITPMPSVNCDYAYCFSVTPISCATNLINYDWSITGPSGYSSSSTGSSQTFCRTLPGPGVYIVDVFTSDLLNTAYATLSFTVPTLVTPTVTASANPSTICSGQTTTLTAGGASTYTWNPGGMNGSPVIASPSSTTVYTVAGTNSVGCVATKTVQVTVNPAPSLTVSASSPSLCSGGSTTLTASGATTYNWNPGNLSGTSVVVTPTATTVYTVTGTSAGCTATKTIQVLVNPTPTITSIPSSPSICSGSSATLTATGGTSYTWTPGSLTGSVVVVTPTVNTTYTLTAATPCGTRTNTILITVNTVPNLTVAVSPTVICAGSSATLTASGASAYTWTPGNMNGSPITVSPSTTTTYTLTGANGICVNTKTVTLTVNPQPTLAISGPTLGCSGININLIASGGVAGTYTWMPCTGTCTTTLKTFAPTVTTTYTLLGQNSYGCIGNVTKTVIVNPRPTITVNAPTICPSGTATLTASGGTDYYWQPSGVNSPTIAYSPSVTTVYSLTAYGITGTSPSTTSCYSNLTTTVTLSNPSVSVSSASICLGKTVLLTASGASSYTWSPSNNTGASINVTPTVTTVYTVTGTNAAGCVAKATSTVTVGAASSFSVSSTATDNYPVIGSAVTVSAIATPAGTYTYNWVPIGVNAASATFTPTDNAVYTCNVTDHCGNTIPTSLCITVESSLCAAASQTTYANYTASGANAHLTSNTITVTGTLTIGSGSDVIFDQCVLKMGSNAKIVVDPTSKLSVSSTTVFSCEGMWYGIEAQSNATSSATVELKGASIEDAYLAVTANNASTNVNNILISNESVLNKNYTDFSIKNASGSSSYPLSVYSNSLTSNATNTSPGNSLKCSGYYSPAVRKRSYAGIDASNAVVVDVMNNNTAIHFNVVKNKDYGLYFTNTNANVYNINFSDFDGSQVNTCIPFIGCSTTYAGVAVRSESSGYLKVKPTSTPTTGALTFTNVAYGILANSTTTVDVQYGEFTNPAQYLGPFGTTGIGRNAIIANNATGVFRANFNSITEMYNAISSAYTSGPSGSFLLSASQNTISAGTGKLTTAISVQSSISFSPATASMRVNGNTITGAANGIYINNIKNGLRVSSNTITMPYVATGGFAGIKLTGTQNATIDANTISSTNIANTGLSGIYLQLSPACRTQCNSISTVGQSVVFEGNCSSPVFGFNNNLMTNATDGMVLKNNGVIGRQGITTPFVNSSGNQWLGSYGNSKTLVMDAGSSAQNSNLVVRNNSNEYPQPQSLNKTLASPGTDNYGTAIFNSPASIFTVTASGFNCPTAQTTGSRMAQADTSGDGYVQALNDTALYNLLSGPIEDAVIVEETREINRAYVYNVLAGGYATNHTGLNAFYEQQSDSIVAQYHGVDSLLQQGNYYQAQNQNAQAAPATQIQANQQLVNEALAKYGTNPQAGFVQEELDKLTTLANSCPLQQGTSVYQARTLLSVLFNNSLVFTDNCEFDGKSGRKTKTGIGTGAKNSFTLYPNPNNGVMYLKYELNTKATINIYDISGRALYKHGLNATNSVLEIQTELSNGVYFYSIQDETGKVLQTDKLIIMK